MAVDDAELWVDPVPASVKLPDVDADAYDWPLVDVGVAVEALGVSVAPDPPSDEDAELVDVDDEVNSPAAADP